MGRRLHGGVLGDGAAQPVEVGLLPSGVGALELPLVPVDEPGLIAVIQQDVAHVEVRVKGAGLVALADGHAHPVPGAGAGHAGVDALIQRGGAGNGGGHQVRPVTRARADRARRHRCRHGEAAAAQLRHQPPFPERARALAARPDIDIPGETRDDAPAPVVAQHHGCVGAGEEPRTVAADAAAGDQTTGVQRLRIEQPRRQGIHEAWIMDGVRRPGLLYDLMVHTPAISFADPPERLCLFRLSAIGDCCHMVPVVRTLQAAWPRTRITWIIGRTEAALLGDLDGVECITFDKKAGRAGRRALKAQLAGRRFDAMLLMQVALRASLASRAVRAPLRLGFDRDRSKDLHGLFVNRRIAPHPQAHVMDGFFDFLRAMGLHERVLRWDVPVPAEARAAAEALIPDDAPTLVISPCSSQRFNNFRNWPAERYAAVARWAVREQGMQVLLTGGPSDEERSYAEAIQREAGVPVIDRIGQTSLKELFALLQRATVLVSPDSGPAHMAVAAGTPVVGLYATSNPWRTGPYLSQQWVVNRYPEAVRAELGKPVDAIDWGRRVRKPDAMELITVDDVLERIGALLATAPEDWLTLPPEGA